MAVFECHNCRLQLFAGQIQKYCRGGKLMPEQCISPIVNYHKCTK